jgi:hypothetical protein
VRHERERARPELAGEPRGEETGATGLRRRPEEVDAAVVRQHTFADTIGEDDDLVDALC